MKILEVSYNTKRDRAIAAGFESGPNPREVPHAGFSLLTFYLGEEHAGTTVRLHSDALEPDDQMFTAVDYRGWTVPVPFLVDSE